MTPLIRAGLAAVLTVAALMQDAAAQANGVLREVYANIGGTSVSDLLNSPRFPASPDEEAIAPDFEAPVDFSDNYGQRMRALLVAPVTGSYVFYISGDDNSILYLSPNDTPASKVQIATVNAWTSSREWTRESNQRSAPINLTAGNRYYIEALQKEGGGGDNLAVTWQRPGDPAVVNGAAPIPGASLVPYGLGPPVITVQPSNVSVVEGGSGVMTVQLARYLGAVFQWERNGLLVHGATNASIVFGPAQLADNDSTFRCSVANPYGSTNTLTATLTVTPDVTRPELTSVGSLGDPRILTVIFSEPVELASATAASNYQIDQGVTVTAAVFGADSRTVILTTTPMSSGRTYVLTVEGVRDRATTPNVIAAGAQRSFSLDVTPLDVALLRPPPEPIGPSTRHGPLVLSEIMYHPADRSDGRDLEFVEVYNSNPYFEDLSGCRLAGEIEFTFPANTILAGRGYLVVAAVPSDLQSVYSLTNIIGGYTGKLSNAGGTVQLLNRQGAILFQVEYSDQPPWPAAADGAGHSLVLARPSFGERDPAAWAASDRAGGSPGTLEPATFNPYRSVQFNEILAHTDEPDVDYIELFNYSSQPVDLSGCVLTDDPTAHRYVFAAGTTIAAQGFLSLNQAQLGFALDAAGETVYLIDPATPRVLDSVRFGAQENGVAWGRHPDGALGFQRLEGKTPGQPNGRPRIAEVGINEILYDPVSGDPDDEYLELHNRTAEAVDVGLWTIEGGVSFTVPEGTVIAPDGYLVIARNAPRVLTNHPGLTSGNTLGNYQGSLANRGERIALAKPDTVVSTNAANVVVTNTIHIVVDEVTYGIGGRWGRWSHGGGSSLELRDWRTDHRLPSNWADSDETGTSGWMNLEFTGVLDNGSVAADSLQIILLGAGECLVDNVEVIPAGGGNRIANSTFEGGMEGWVAQGNHEDSGLEIGEGFSGSRSLRVRAAGRGDTGANRIRTTLTQALSSGSTATIRAKVRWLAGCPEILFRLRGNWLEASGNMLTTRRFGTPGAPNGRAVGNAGPAITGVTHQPVLPAANQAVTVIARAHDADGLATLVLKYRVDPSTNLTLVPMINNGAGLFSGVIPGQLAGRIAAFHIEAADNHSSPAMGRFPDDAPARECLVRWGDPAQGGNFGTYRFWISQTNFNRWSTRVKLSNKPVDCTFAYGNYRVIYNIGGQYSGSPYHSPGFNTPTGNVCDYVLNFPEDDLLLGETDFTLQWPGNGGGDNSYQREQTAYWMAAEMGLPFCYRRHVNLFVNGVRRGQMFEDAQQPNGDLVDSHWPGGENGDLHKIQLWFEFDDAASGFTPTGASLQRFTTTGGQKKLARYRWTFARRAVADSANNFTNLFALVDAVNFTGTGPAYRRQLEAHLDVDNWLRTYAVQHAVGNNDSFAYGGGQNMYTYKPVGDTWKLLIWDIDFAFNAQPPNSDMFTGIGRSNGIDLSDPAFRRRYWEILQDLANGPLNAARVNPVLDAKYNAMVANGRSIENPSAIKSYISQRRNHLLGLIATNVSANFAITLNGGAGFSTNRNWVTLTGTAPVDVRSLRINGVGVPVTWTSISAWSVPVVLQPGANALLVEGLDSNGGVIAEHLINVVYTGADETPEGRLVINEIMYHPSISGAAFVEILNTSASSAFDLLNWRLAGVDFVFPPGSILPPGAYGVVAENRLAFASAYGATIPILGEFAGRLQHGGETLRLVRPGTAPGPDLIVDEVRYDSEPPWPAAANGTGASLQLIDPTRDNNRVGNWDAVDESTPPPGPQWRYVSVSGTASSPLLYVYLQSAGSVYIDDLKLVPGGVAESGVNSIQNGGFESAFPGPWTVSANHSGSVISTSVKRVGNASLNLVASSGGTTQGSSLWQTCSPALTAGSLCTLSFWYLENPNGGTLTIRLSGNGVTANVNLAPGAGPASALRATPGAVNSVAASLPEFPTVWLNEVLARNATGIMDQPGHRHPWAELYNGGNAAINLAGLHLAGDPSNPTQWPFPPGASLGAGQFMTIWLDGNPGETTANELHANFAAVSENGMLLLVQTNGSRTLVLDYLKYGSLQPDRSYGSWPDGAVSGRRLFHYTTPGGTNDPASAPVTVFINEWMADNVNFMADPADGDFEDWFELYNPADTDADLSGFYLGTSLAGTNQFRIPPGYGVPARGHLLVWADDETNQNGSNQTALHTNFKLAKSGEALGLFDPDGRVVDFVTFGEQAGNVTQGRYPDGGGSVLALSLPTPGAGNYLATSNSPPVIGNLPDRTVVAGQTLVFMVTATDADLPPQTLTFSLDPGAPTGAVLNPATGLFSWRPESVPGGGAPLVAVRVADNGAPPLSTVKTFRIHVLPAPQVTGITVTAGGGYSIAFESIPGRSYRLEYKGDLNDPAWLPLGADQIAPGNLLTFEDELPASAQRFYRIVLLD